jgi:hypothetical protein
VIQYAHNYVIETHIQVIKGRLLHRWAPLGYQQVPMYILMYSMRAVAYVLIPSEEVRLKIFPCLPIRNQQILLRLRWMHEY